MKKILIIIPSIKKGGGAEQVATIIGNTLHKLGYKINYITYYNTNNKILIHGDEFCLNEKNSKNIFFNFFKLFKRTYYIIKFCKKNNIDVCISHLDEANFSLLLSKIFLRHKVKVIVEIHNSIEKSLSKIYVFLYKILLRFANTIVSLTKEDRKNIIDTFHIKTEKVVNIYNPIDIKKIRKLIQEKDTYAQKNKDTFIFTHIGRLTHQKNQKLLIDAFYLFQKEYPNSILHILGEGEKEQKLKKQVKLLGLDKNVIFLGLQQNPYIFLYNSHCLVMSSYYEGFPVVQVESLACRKPIISTDCKTGPREIIMENPKNFERGEENIIGDTGILIPENNVQKMYEAMKIITSNQELYKKMIQKIDTISSKFDIDTIIKQWIEIIKS